MTQQNEIQSFSSYWQQYNRAHRSPVSRACHAAGIVLGALTAAALIATGMFFFLPLAVVVADLCARLGHKLAPRDTRWRAGGAPVWAALADIKMSALLLSGRLDRPSDPSSPSAA